MRRRYLNTFILVLLAGGSLYSFYQNDNINPWTRDAQVRASIVKITPRVTGQVSAIHIDDNSHVKQGELLFEIDDRMYRANLNQAIAAVNQTNALVAKAKNEQTRAVRLEKLTPGAVPALTLNNLAVAVETATANRDAATANQQAVELNLDFTKVYAPVDGYITNLNLRIGAQVIANQPVVALIDENSFWIEGFFKENDLQGVAANDKAYVTLLMNDKYTLSGKVLSIGFGIAKLDGSTGNDLLPTVNPNFQWIRLAQRIPVKIKLNNVPKEIQLRVGMTASVQITKQQTTFN
ncbi:HlyD family secretion protein [Aliivibrio sp. 1S128]|uniref:HlyD family secretion protein n=1 Tax=Aliivibrio sp. 1S128 TaxID=1840085 RepID=UPI00080E068E|nr:HlyD family secretion protein [Aliivibrio sp. 1S128]OCH19682.1 efflux transporter periplasmic adaptor subunit [Aliivibrio sp. 1S128]